MDVDGKHPTEELLDEDLPTCEFFAPSYFLRNLHHSSRCLNRGPPICVTTTAVLRYYWTGGQTYIRIRDNPCLYNLVTGALYRPRHWSPLPRQKHIRAHQRPGRPHHTMSLIGSHSTPQSATAAKEYLSARGVNPIVK